jgi:hypothetical protein
VGTAKVTPGRDSKTSDRMKSSLGFDAGWNIHSARRTWVPRGRSARRDGVGSGARLR